MSNIKLYTEEQMKSAFRIGLRANYIDEQDAEDSANKWIKCATPIDPSWISVKDSLPKPLQIDENTSDGYHTFKELYEFRKVYNAALFNEWAKLGNYFVHKSWKHHDGELCFGGGWFIVVAILPTGQISNHYEAKDWDLFKIPETPTAIFEFDGHTPKDVLKRLTTLNK